MTPEKYIKLFYPDAICDYSKRYKAYVVVTEIEGEGEGVVIGRSEFFESIAWEDAKRWIRSLPAESKPEIQIHK
jgi:hypothetical protein